MEKYLCLKHFTTERANQHLQDNLGANASPYSKITPWCAEFLNLEEHPPKVTLTRAAPQR